jgi:hypothetical protein
LISQSRGLGDVYKRQVPNSPYQLAPVTKTRLFFEIKKV